MIRPFEHHDQRAVETLIQDGLSERWGNEFDESFNVDVTDMVVNYIDKGADVLVVEVDGIVVATGTLMPHDNKRARIVRMSVAASHRRQGLARAVVDALIEMARKRGLTEVLVSTDTPWTSAVALYASCGFVEVSRDETDVHFIQSL